MTYCIGIKAKEGLVFASDSRTNAGLSDVNIYSKMFTYDIGDRSIILVTSGNLSFAIIFRGSEQLSTLPLICIIQFLILLVIFIYLYLC